MSLVSLGPIFKSTLFMKSSSIDNGILYIKTRILFSSGFSVPAEKGFVSNASMWPYTRARVPAQFFLGSHELF